MRRVGVEIEFTGLELAEASELIGDALAVKAEEVSPHEHHFRENNSDPWRLEVDFLLLKRLSRKQSDDDNDDALRKLAINALDAVASIATPLELVSPPLAESRLPELDKLVTALGTAGAVGTGESAINAFGVHFNPEASLDPVSVASHIKAFLVLHDWLKARDSTDLARRITPYIDPFPEAYEQQMLQSDFWPAAPQLIEHYLEHNPTRNRALDLLPLMAQIDPQRIEACVDDDLIKARPTYHYRLPNSRIGEPGWSLLDPWRDWLTLEQLAANSAALGKLAAARLAYLDQSLFLRREDDWIKQCQQVVDGL